MADLNTERPFSGDASSSAEVTPGCPLPVPQESRDLTFGGKNDLSQQGWT